MRNSWYSCTADRHCALPVKAPSPPPSGPHVSAHNPRGMATEVNNPLVFSCRSCRSILGDSWHFVAANEEMNCIALDAVNEEATTVVKDDFITSKSGADEGSTFYLVSCKQCSDVVGRIYKTTSANLDQFRGCYTLDRESLDSYELGTGRSITAAQALGDLLPVRTSYSTTASPDTRSDFTAQVYVSVL